MDDYSAPLPNGYSIERTSADRVSIMGPKDMGEVIPPNIVEMAVIDQIVAGRVVGRDLRDTGYFVLDARSGSHATRLPREEWIGRLRALGVESEPSLRRPRSTDDSR